MREYEVFYRARGNKDANVTSTTMTCNSKAEARKGFEEWDNAGKEWTIVKIERVDAQRQDPSGDGYTTEGSKHEKVGGCMGYIIVGDKGGVNGCVIDCGFYTREDAEYRLRQIMECRSLQDEIINIEYDDIRIEREDL